MSDGVIIHRYHEAVFIAILAVLLAATVALLFLVTGEVAFESIGFSPLQYALIMTGTLFGSAIDVPVWRVSGTEPVAIQQVRVFGVLYRIPQVRYARVSTVIAVNIGGAVIPTTVSIYLLSLHPGLWQPALEGTLITAFLVHLMAKKVPGAGIVTPALLPPVVAALMGYFLAPSSPAVVAYVCGTLGALIGADLTNLRGITKLGASVVSIGGAGTFDGVFLTGIMAALLASLL